MKKILLCPPTYFNIEYEINPWMHVENNVKKTTVQDEYKLLKQTYLELGVEVVEIQPEPGVPDMVYTANLGCVKDKTFISANFKFPQRQKEVVYSEKFFNERGFKIIKLPQLVKWEGEGDFLKIGNKYFMGYGKRSDLEASTYLSKILNAEVIPLRLVDPYFYHLDMCFFPLDEDTVAINPRSFDQEGINTIRQNFTNVIESSNGDNLVMGCNAEVIGKTIVAARGITNELKNKYMHFGFKIKEIPMGEYRKGGGSIKCLSLEFH